MRIIAIGTLRAFWERHPDARLPLSEWYFKVEAAQWHSFADMKKDYPSANYVGNQHYVFNIKGNKYRLIAAVKYTPRLVFVRFVGTHEEYGDINVKDI